jgi:hypothetical protein
MHILAIISGVWFHLSGDIGLCIVGAVMASGCNGHVCGAHYEFPSLGAAAFKLLPIPIGLSVAGLIVARWGIAGL